MSPMPTCLGRSMRVIARRALKVSSACSAVLALQAQKKKAVAPGSNLIVFGTVPLLRRLDLAPPYPRIPESFLLNHVRF